MSYYYVYTYIVSSCLNFYYVLIFFQVFFISFFRLFFFSYIEIWRYADADVDIHLQFVSYIIHSKLYSYLYQALHRFEQCILYFSNIVKDIFYEKSWYVIEIERKKFKIWVCLLFFFVICIQKYQHSQWSWKEI